MFKNKKNHIIHSFYVYFSRVRVTTTFSVAKTCPPLDPPSSPVPPPCPFEFDETSGNATTNLSKDRSLRLAPPQWPHNELGFPKCPRLVNNEMQKETGQHFSQEFLFFKVHNQGIEQQDQKRRFLAPFPPSPRLEATWLAGVLRALLPRLL